MEVPLEFSVHEHIPAK